MVDAAHSVTTQGPVTLTQSRTSWGLQIGRHRLAVTRVSEARSIGGPTTDPCVVPPARRESTWLLLSSTLAGVCAAGLLGLAAVSQGKLPFAGNQRYLVSVPLPVPAIKATSKPASTPEKPRATAILPASSLSRNAGLASPRVEVGHEEFYFVRAMRTGELQEWVGADGHRRFLSVGAEQMDGERRCRELALLIRLTDGSNEVRNSRRCAGGRAQQRVALTDGDRHPASDVPPNIDPVSSDQDVSR